MKPFDLQDTAMILIDHQVGTNTWAMSTPLELLQRNVLTLAKFAKGTFKATIGRCAAPRRADRYWRAFAKSARVTSGKRKVATHDLSTKAGTPLGPGIVV